MSFSDQLSLADVKNRLSEVVDRIEREHGRVVITKHGRPAVVVMSVDDLESLEETLSILSNPELLSDVRAGLDEARARTSPSISKSEARTLAGLE